MPCGPWSLHSSCWENRAPTLAPPASFTGSPSFQKLLTACSIVKFTVRTKWALYQSLRGFPSCSCPMPPILPSSLRVLTTLASLSFSAQLNQPFCLGMPSHIVAWVDFLDSRLGSCGTHSVCSLWDLSCFFSHIWQLFFFHTVWFLNS